MFSSSAQQLSSSDKNYLIEETDNSIKCTIPVNTPNFYDFCKGIDHLEIKGVIDSFVSKKLAEYGVKQNIERYDIGEMVKNSCDSFVSKRSVEIGTNLEILVNIKRENDAVIVKFKDNGKGLDTPGKFFKVSDIVNQSWSSKTYKFFGGNKIGLEQMNRSIERQGGTMQLKKRKNGGCAVYVKFFSDNKTNAKVVDDQVNVNEKQQNEPENCSIM